MAKFRLWGRKLPWQQQFEGQVLLKFEVFAYLVDLGSGETSNFSLVELNLAILKCMISSSFAPIKFDRFYLDRLTRSIRLL